MSPPPHEGTFDRVDVAIVVALALEAAPICEMLVDGVRLRAAGGLRIDVGTLGRRRTAVITAGVGREAAVAGVRLAVEGHRPSLVIGAGLCGGLRPDLSRYDVIVAREVVRPVHGCREWVAVVPNEWTAGAAADVRSIRLVTTDSVIATPEAKRDLRASTAADAVDMESWWIAETTAAYGLPWQIVRVVGDTFDERIPADVAALASATHSARRAGAVVRTLFRRPSAIGDLAEFRERACEAADRLAARLAVMAGKNPPESDGPPTR